MPDVQLGKTHSAIELPEKDRKQIYELTRLMVEAVYKEDLKPLIEHIHPEKGVYIDLKAPRTKSEFENQVLGGDVYFRKFYFDGEFLRKESQDPGQVSLKELFEKNDKVTADIYLETGGKQAELILKLSDTPEEDYRINHLIFIRDNNRWYFYQLL